MMMMIMMMMKMMMIMMMMWLTLYLQFVIQATLIITSSLGTREICLL